MQKWDDLHYSAEENLVMKQLIIWNKEKIRKHIAFFLSARIFNIISFRTDLVSVAGQISRRTARRPTGQWSVLFWRRSHEGIDGKPVEFPRGFAAR